MGRPPKASVQDEQAVVTPKTVLKKNHGYIANGRESRFYPAGSEFDPIDDAALIAALIQSGAILE